MSALRRPHDFGFGFRGSDLLGDVTGERLRTFSSGEVDHSQRQPRQLIGENACEPPYRGAGEPGLAPPTVACCASVVTINR